MRARRRGLIRDETGAGGILALVAVALLAVVALAAVGMGAALAARQRVVAAADAGALAAADTALGLHPGVPCQVAEQVVASHDATLVACEADGVVVTVTARATVAGVPVEVRSRAGPPRGDREGVLGS